MEKQVEAAGFDPVLVAACAAQGVDPAEVLAWRRCEDRVVLVLRDGRKLQKRTED